MAWVTHKIQLYRDYAEKWRWRVKHVNGHVIAESSESYHNRTDAERAMRRMFKAWAMFRVEIETNG